MNDTRSTGLAAVDNILRKRWRWGLAEFAAALGRDQTDPYLRRQYESFQQAGRALNELPDDVLEVITADTPLTPAPARQAVAP